MSAKVFTIGGHTISYGGVLLREAGAGALTISKTVTGTGFDPAKTFELTVTFDKAVTYNGTTSTTHTFNLASGQSATITGIPENTHYEVAETPLSPADIAAGYRIGSMTGGAGTIPRDASVSASATNIYAHGSLSLNIAVAGSNYNASKFKFTVIFDSPIRYSVNGVLIETPSSTYSGDFSQGTPVVLGSIPQNVSYTITETPFSEEDANSGYSTGTITGATGTMPYNGALSATLRYTYVYIPATVNGYRFKFAGYPQPGWKQYAVGEWINYSGTDIYDLITDGTSLSLDIFKPEYYNWKWYSGQFEIIQASPGGIGNSFRFDFGDRITRAVNLNLPSHFFAKEMFAGCTALTEVAFTNTPQLWSCERMFDGCASLTSVPALTLRPFDTQSGGPTGVSSVRGMFRGCTALESLPALNTDTVRTFDDMCGSCASLKTVPLLPTGAARSVDGMFFGCYKVESGALALYNQMAAQRLAPTHTFTFTNCGRDTASGAAELAQIPSDWK